MPFVTILFALAFGVACEQDKGGAGASPLQLDGKSYAAVGDATALTHGDSEVGGTGSIVFQDPLAASTDAGQNIAFTATLENGGSLSLAAFADAGLANGLVLTLSRADALLSAALTGADGTKSLTEYFTGVDATGSITISADIHNDEDPTHVLIWGDTEEFTEATALFNSEEDAAPGHGDGTAWGFTLDKATLTSAANSEPKFEG